MSQAILLLLLSLVNLVAGLCQIRGIQAQAEPLIDNCFWYRDQACCTVTEARLGLDQSLLLNNGDCTALSDDCHEALETIECAGLCDPNFSDYQDPSSLKPRLCESLLDDVYGACKNQEWEVDGVCTTLVDLDIQDSIDMAKFFNLIYINDALDNTGVCLDNSVLTFSAKRNSLLIALSIIFPALLVGLLVFFVWKYKQYETD